MAGLNHEMTRELLWNELPTDQRGTYFRQFWDATSYIQGETKFNPEGLRDVLLLSQWNQTSGLGDNSPRPQLEANGEYLVLLLRAQLISRFPNLVVYAAEATDTVPSTLSHKYAHPIFARNLDPDVAFYGFPLSKETLLKGNGWYFVLQEQPGEPRFFKPGSPGSHVAPPATTAATSAKMTYQPPYRVAIHASTLFA